MQAIHNISPVLYVCHSLFQRAKIQDKCKQFTTSPSIRHFGEMLFQRAKIQDKCKQFTTEKVKSSFEKALFQRAKIQDKCKQFTTDSDEHSFDFGCFKEQRYKINASNSQLPNCLHLQICLMVALDERQAAADFVAVVVDGAADAGIEHQVVERLPFS